MCFKTKGKIKISQTKDPKELKETLACLLKEPKVRHMCGGLSPVANSEHVVSRPSGSRSSSSHPALTWGSPGQCFDYSLKGNLSLNCTAKPFLDSWFTETMWDNKYLLLLKKWERHKRKAKGRVLSQKKNDLRQTRKCRKEWKTPEKLHKWLNKRILLSKAILVMPYAF